MWRAWQDDAMGRGRLVLGITAWAAPVLAHVQPSVDDNNRYLKVTPAADRVRLAYTVFFGEVPGAQTRPQIDANHDGRLDDAESGAFGHALAAEVAASLELTLDGVTQPVRWTMVAVGLNTPTTAGGAFAVDLVAWPCLTTAGGRHQLLLHDRFRIPRPGETEVRIEDAPGITVDHARVGATVTSDTLTFVFVGPGGPLTDDGLDLAFTAAGPAPRSTDGTCAAVPRAPVPGTSTGLVVGAAAVLGLGLAGGMTVRRRRRARR